MVIWYRIGRLCKHLRIVGAEWAVMNPRWIGEPHHRLQHHFHSRRNPSFIYALTRSFAVPAQFRPKSSEEESGTRINEAVTASLVRLVTEEGHHIVPRREALERARRLNLDLVEVQRNADPPVCKIMDFHKENFKREAQEKERAKSKSAIALRSGDCKDVRISVKTELKDLKIKAEMITRLMERGYRVKCTALPGGKPQDKPQDNKPNEKPDKPNNMHKEKVKGKEDNNLGDLLNRLLVLIEDVAVVESGPHMVDNRQAYAIVRHTKFATKKCGKKVTKVSDVLGRADSTESNLDGQLGQQLTDANRSSNQRGQRATTDFIPIHQMASASKSVPDSSRSNVESSREQRGLKHSVGSIPPQQSGPSIVQGNRYAKQSELPNRYSMQSEPRGAQQRNPMERVSRNGTDARGQLPPRERQFNPNLTSPPSGRGVAPASKTDSSGVPNDSNLPTKGFGIFSAVKPAAASGDQKPSSSALRPKFGVFISSKTDASNERKKSGEKMVDKGRENS